MLGLAVGIDYALFIISRHQDQLKQGMHPEESTARSVATAGSAVVFAGLTVIIALVGLSVANIPFLTTMGIAAAGGVAIAVVIALTLTPALLGFAGERLRPKERRAKKKAATAKQVAGAHADPEVEPDSPAAEAGLKRGQVIRSVAGKNLKSPREFAQVVSGLSGPVAVETDLGPITIK